ncbi:hypothetical protein PHISP_08661, partial [Aspergillus sp. HF37]
GFSTVKQRHPTARGGTRSAWRHRRIATMPHVLCPRRKPRVRVRRQSMMVMLPLTISPSSRRKRRAPS